MSVPKDIRGAGENLLALIREAEDAALERAAKLVLQAHGAGPFDTDCARESARRVRSLKSTGGSR